MLRSMRRTVLVAAVAIGFAAAAVFAATPATEHEGESMEPKKLTPEEERVIVQKGTERPFSGKYWDHHEDGTYRCRRCGTPLFSSDTKFDSGSGWPSFDDALPGAVREVPDADGRRTEIVCAACSAHLGHVFRGEGFTERGVRHCVNSASLDFAAESAAEPQTGHAYFAGGCFWGVEYWLDKAPGVLSAESGYMGGHKERPTYKEVCYTDTGHAETVHVVFDPTKTSYEALARLFFEIHDPTEIDRQGPDVGRQYRSAVFYTSDGEKEILEGLIGKLRARGLRVATKLEPAGKFWRAEEYHQDYYVHKRSEPYCHARVDRFGD